MAPRSLRNRLVLGAAAVGFAFALLFGTVAAWRVSSAEDQAVHAALETRIELARDEVAPDGSMRQDAGSPKTDLVQVIGPAGDVRSSSPALVGAPPLVDVAAVRAAPGAVERRLSMQQPDTDLAVLAVPLALTGTTGSPAGAGALVVAVDAEGFNTATDQLLGLLLVGLCAVVVGMTALTWWLTGRALHSVTRITEDAERLSPEDLGTGLPVPHSDAELTRLVEALNRMLGRLHRSHVAELTFAAGAGHRLRTPVATLRAEAELALAEPDHDRTKAALLRIVADADQLTSIVDRMLNRSRALESTAAPVLEILSPAMSHWYRQAELARVTLTVRSAGEIGHTRSCTELAEVVDPVVDNAIRHTPPDGAIDIDVLVDAAHGGSVLVRVSNTGEPIPSDIAPRIFDAWVSSRDATVAGGLGLWLARETACDLGGDVTLVDDGPYPTTFQVRLPVIGGK